MKKLLLILIPVLLSGCEKVEFPSYPNWLFQGKWQLVDIVATNSVTNQVFHLDSALISESTIQTYSDTLRLKKDFTTATIENKLKKYTFWEFSMTDRFKILVNPKDGLDGRKRWENEIPVNFHIDIYGNYVGFKMSRNGHLYTFENKSYLVITIGAPKVVTMVRRNGNVEIFVSEYTTLTFQNK